MNKRKGGIYAVTRMETIIDIRAEVIITKAERLFKYYHRIAF